jgi:predicted nucleic acid-binding protein
VVRLGEATPPLGPRREGSALIVLLDTGGVEALAPMDERRRARLRLLRDEAREIVVPAGVLAEGVLTGQIGHDYHVQRLMSYVDISAVDDRIGYAAGALRQAAIRGGFDPPPSGVDAIVAAEADARAAAENVLIITSDIEDFVLLASLATNASRLSLSSV